MTQKSGTRKQYSLTATIYDKRGRVLSVGSNSYTKSHPLQAHYGALAGKPKAIMLHAEIDAIRRCKNLDKAHVIVIERYDAHGNPVSARPCSACKKAIYDSGIAIIEHT